MIDAGLVTSLSDIDRKNFIDLFYAVATGKGEMVGKLMIERSRMQQCENPELFCQEVAAVVNEATCNRFQLGKIHVDVLIRKVLALCLVHRVKLESNFAQVCLAMGVLEGLGRSLDPDLDILTAITPIVIKSRLLYSAATP